VITGIFWGPSSASFVRLLLQVKVVVVVVVIVLIVVVVVVVVMVVIRPWWDQYVCISSEWVKGERKGREGGGG